MTTNWWLNNKVLYAYILWLKKCKFTHNKESWTQVTGYKPEKKMRIEIQETNDHQTVTVIACFIVWTYSVWIYLEDQN